MRWKFDCNCPLCEEETENCQDEKYEKFESLKQEAETLFEQSNNQFQFGVENMRREVQLYKEMYKLAKEKQASGMFILSDILEEGFNAAVQGYLQVMNNCDNLDNNIGFRNRILHKYLISRPRNGE